MVDRSTRKESDSSTLAEGRKPSLDNSTAMIFPGEEEIKDSMMMDSTVEVPKFKDPKLSAGLIIDINTLKKLLNKASCEFILALIQGTVTAASSSSQQ